MSERLKNSEKDPILWEILQNSLFIDPSSDADAEFWITEKPEETRICFRLKGPVDGKTVENAMNNLVSNGYCAGFDISRIDSGDVRVYYDPALHNSYHRARAIDKTIDALAKGKKRD